MGTHKLITSCQYHTYSRPHFRKNIGVYVHICSTHTSYTLPSEMYTPVLALVSMYEHMQPIWYVSSYWYVVLCILRNPLCVCTPLPMCVLQRSVCPLPLCLYST
jgi:hypothetical protein